MPGPLVPEDDLYARLEVAVDASPEAIELAWRALLKRHHPDVAGDDRAALERAKRINVAHDWLADPTLRARYDRERLSLDRGRGRGRTGVRHGWSPRGPTRPRSQGAQRGSPVSPPRVARRPDLVRGRPAERLARYLDDVSRLTADELDRLATAEPPPIAFLATIRRFVPDAARTAFEEAEARLAARVPHDRWAVAGLREGLLGVAAEIVLADFLDETLDEPFRSRARDRLLRAWQASVEQPRYGPNSAEVELLRVRVAASKAAEVAAFVRASHGIAGDERPWPPALDRDEDEALRISAELACRDVAAALPVAGLSPATATRARRLAARLGHVTALRHAWAPSAYAVLVAPWVAAVGDAPDGGSRRSGPDVRRAC